MWPPSLSAKMSSCTEHCLSVVDSNRFVEEPRLGSLASERRTVARGDDAGEMKGEVAFGLAAAGTKSITQLSRCNDTGLGKFCNAACEALRRSRKNSVNWVKSFCDVRVFVNLGDVHRGEIRVELGIDSWPGEDPNDVTLVLDCDS
jgi:hypothetical protein